jgi:ureidoglycolate lyase
LEVILRRISPVDLTAGEFAPFGDVIEVAAVDAVRNINEGHTERYHDLAKLTLDEAGGQPAINIFRSTPLPNPLLLKFMERHPLSSQAFMPLSGRPYLVVVAPPGDLDESAIRVFLASAHQGVNYHPGTWHHYCLALNEVSDFLVVDRIANDENCDEVMLKESIEIEGL